MNKILIVDDDEMMLMVTRHILAAQYEVLTATTGAQAIEIFRREQPTLVLSDLLMPEMDGYELQRRLQDERGEPVPIMFMTADDSEEAESKGFEVGATDYIRKPFKPDVLLRRVGNVLDNLVKIHELEIQATTDPLTHLLNKSAARREIGAAVATSAGALLIIDLDNFKLVNDLYGHATGDRLLIRFATLLRTTLDAEDLVGRIGGDEFIAYLRDVTDGTFLRHITHSLNENLKHAAEELTCDSARISLGVSVGAVFVSPSSLHDGDDFDAMFTKADAALYAVKSHGKHALKLYGTPAPVVDSSATDMNQLTTMLSERVGERGAYTVDFETFRAVYRLLARIATDTDTPTTLMQLTLPPDAEPTNFLNIISRVLRRSDCVTLNGVQVLILLPLTDATEADVVRNRIVAQLPAPLATTISIARTEITAEPHHQ